MGLPRSHSRTALDNWTAIGGVGLTLLASLGAARFGAQVSLTALGGSAALIGAYLLFLRAPHVGVALSIPLFTAIPMLKLFVNPLSGSLKELIILAAAAAALTSTAFERRHVDSVLTGATALLLALYLVNVGNGDHGGPWLQGLRLVAEPLILLLVGLSLTDPRRVLKWALRSLVLTCTASAAYGILQQVVGEGTLLSWGYEYEAQVRSIDGRLRSFGPADDPFAYAGLLYFGLAAIALERRRPAWTYSAAGIILLGLLFSYVRTGALVLVAIGGLMLVRQGLARPGALLMVAAVVAGLVVLVTTSGTATSSYSVAAGKQTGGRLNVILNGRVSAWTAAVGDEPGGWFIGRGVGEVGTAAERAGYSLTAGGPQDDDEDTGSAAVDSGYLATMADVGLIGLAVLLTLLGRIGMLAVAGARLGSRAATLAGGFLAVLLLDAVTRASFTGFPTAFLGLLLIGVCLAAAGEEEADAVPLPAR